MDTECPKCGFEFEVSEWYNGNCPACGKEYWWDAMWAEPEDEEYGILMWED